MNILKNNNIMNKQTENYIIGELSNVAIVIQKNKTLTIYYSIDANASTTILGLRSNYDPVGSTSDTVYNLIDDLPICGLSNGTINNEFNPEVGWDAEFESEALIFPDTVVPKPGDIFMIKGSTRLALFMVTNTTQTIVRDSPFIKIMYKLYSTAERKLKELNAQVKEEYNFIVNSIGADKVKVILKSNYFKIQHHVENYINIIDFYKAMFLDEAKGGVFDFKTYIGTDGVQVTIIDLLLLKMMFEESIIAFDPIIIYNNANLKSDCDTMYIDEIAIINQSTYKKSIFKKILNKKNNKSSEKDFINRHQSYFMENSQISKYTGPSVYTVEFYYQHADDNQEFYDELNIFTEDFTNRILNNIPYPEPNKDFGYVEEFNYKLHNVIIAYYNDEPIDFDDLYIEDNVSGQNYYLIPILLYIYRQYIETLQK